MYIKNFKDWLVLKENIDKSERGPNVKERDIWWCSLGQNIGNEMDGKNELFHRPVIIVKKLSGDTVLVAPITSKEKDGSWYFRITLKGENRTVCLHQIRIINTKRLGKSVARLSESQFIDLKDSLKSLYF